MLLHCDLTMSCTDVVILRIVLCKLRFAQRQTVCLQHIHNTCLLIQSLFHISHSGREGGGGLYNPAGGYLSTIYVPKDMRLDRELLHVLLYQSVLPVTDYAAGVDLICSEVPHRGQCARRPVQSHQRSCTA